LKLNIFLIFIILSLVFIPAGGEVIFVPGNYSLIQDAVNSSSDGDTIIVRDGTYSVYLKLNKSITLKSENGTANCILEASTNDDVIEVHADYVNITGFTIRNGNDDGIDVEPYNSDPSDYVNISGNVFYNLYGGIQIEDSNFSVIMNNNISAVTDGIYYIGSSYHNLIVNNTISNSDNGIDIPAGDGSVIYLNKFINNSLHARDCGNNSWNSTEMRDYTYQRNVFTNYTGNYWDDYVGFDANGDGIGDTPYNISDEFCGGGGRTSSQPKDYYPMLSETLAPPQISNIQESGLTNSSITISWQTNIIANNRILYSLNEDLSSSEWSEWDNNTANPSITLSGLLANTTYYYSVYSYRTDNASIYSNSSIRNFTTVKNPKTWYVDDDGLNCSANFTTIQDAVNASIDGDTIIVCNGTYIGNITVDKSLNITGIDNPFINAYNVGAGFVLRSDDNVIQGFTIDRAGMYGLGAQHSDYNFGVYLLQSSERNTIRDNNFTNGGGVYISSNNNNVIQNYFENSSVIIENTWINGGRYNNIANNEFYCSNPDLLNPLIWVESKFSSDISTFNRIENNTINRTSQSSLAIVLIENHMEGNTISGNTIKGNIAIRVDSDYNWIINNTLQGLEGLPLSTDVGIKLAYAKNCVVNNNTIELYNYGIHLIPSETPYISSRTNLTMSGNHLSNNTYHLYIDLPPDADTISPTFNSFDNNITSTNIIVDGGEKKKIYYLKNQSDTIFSYSDAAFFACINCNNITVRFLTPEDNSHGIILYNTTHSLIENVIASDNAIVGAAIYNSDNITIEGSYFYNNGEEGTDSIGVYFQRTNNSLINDTEVETNWCEGLKLELSNNNIIQNSNFTDNGPAYYLPPVSEDCDAGKGLSLDGSNNNTLKGSYILATSIPEEGSWRGGQKYGVHLYSSNNNTIYNNYFNNTINAYDSGFNLWNISKTSGENIINGPYLGGNYWHDYAGMDTVGGDGLGDTLLPYNSSGNIQNGGDYLPLTAVIADTTAPSIHVVSPVESGTYSASYVYLEVYSPDPDAYKWWYSLNSGVNVSFTPNTTISGLSNGNYSLTVYVNDTAGNINSTTVNFTISITTGGVGRAGGAAGGGGSVAKTPLEEVTQPDFEITILSPESKQYVERDLQLSFTSPLPLRRASVIIDDSSTESVSISVYATSGSVEISCLHLGKHKIIVNGEDYYGRRGKGEAEFEIIPLTLGEINVTGTQTTPRFADDVAFSFLGRNADYILRFEAKGEVEIDVYINKFYRGSIQPYNNLSGGLIYSFKPNSTYQSYEVPVSAKNITEDVENIVSFISENTGDGEKSWEIRNVSLIPSITFNFPQIEVFTSDKSISENEKLTPFIRIDGIINSSDYYAYVYLVTPNGKKLYYPDWSEEVKPLDSYYLRTNYYDRLPSSFYFDGEMSGTYVVAAKIVTDGSIVSLSSDRIYYSNGTSVKLFLNREIFSEGQEVIVEHALTGKGNVSLIISMENPDGEITYLPMLSDKPEVKEYKPVKSDYFTAFDDFVTGWKEGHYILRSNLYNESGELIAEDIRTFEVCSGTSALEGKYIRKVSENDVSSFVLSRIRLVDYYTLQTKEFEFKGDHYGYSIKSVPGRYYLAGFAISEEGRMYSIPLTEINLNCGEVEVRNIILDSIGSLNREFIKSLELETYSELMTDVVHNEARFDDNSNFCSKPKVLVTVGPPWNGSEVGVLADYLATLLSKTSPGVEIITYGDVRNFLTYQEDKILLGGEADYSKVAGMIKDVQYIMRFSYARFDDTLLMNANMLDFDLVQVFYSTSIKGGEILETADEITRSMGDISKIIENYEISNPVPPRDPMLFVTLTPESVTFEENKDRAEIRVEVKDCRGNPVKGARVYFKEITDKGFVKADGEEWISNLGSHYVYSVTDSKGIAKAEYVLDQSKGVKKGVDKIDIFTKKRGRSLKHNLAIIKIAGIGIEIKAGKETISLKQETDLFISLYKEELDGDRELLAGRTILIEKYGLLDGKIVVMSVADSYGNPVTNENGNAVIKYIAGKKEGIVKIPAVYQGLGHTNAPTDTAFIKVKKDEFVINIRWSEEYNYYKEYHRKRYCGEPLNRIREGEYSLNFEAKIIWDRKSEREVSSASVRFKEDESGSWNGRLCGEEWYVCPGDSPPRANCANWWEDEKTAWYHRNADIYSNLKGKGSFRKILREGKAGELFLRIDPIKIEMTLKGQLTSTGGGTWVTKKNGEVVGSQPMVGDKDYNYNGIHYSPTPSRWINCLPASHPELQSYYYCAYFIPNNFPDDYVRLEKLGKNSYSSFHFTYPVEIDVEGYNAFYSAEYKTKLYGTKEMHVTVVKR